LFEIDYSSYIDRNMRKPIVIIEDDQDLINEIYPRGRNHEVLAYQDIQDITTIVANNPFLILLDDRLTEGYGSTFCLALKSDDRNIDIPVILISAVPNLKTVAEHCGADGFIAKPFELEQLVEVVVRFLPLTRDETSPDAL